MHLHEKLKQLRKEKGITQAQLAEAIYVSRTAVSKWESGRGYPNFDSLKALAVFFGVSTDELLSARTEGHIRSRFLREAAFAILDCSAGLLLFLPLFALREGGVLQTVSLLMLTAGAPVVRAAQLGAVSVLVLWGILCLVLRSRISAACRQRISFILSGCGALLFSLCLQPYAAAFLFFMLAAKAFMFAKRR